MPNTSGIANFRHAQHYYSIADKKRSDWLALDSEFDQIRKALRWLIRQENDAAANLFLVYLFSLQTYFQRRSLYHEEREYCDHALSITQRLRVNPGRILNIKYNALYALGEWQEAYHIVQQALTVTQEADSHQFALAVYNLGKLQINQGNYAEGLHTLRDAENLLSQGELTNELADTKAEIAAYHLNRYELNKALRLYLEVDDLRKNLDPSQPSGHTLLMLGVIYRRKGEYLNAHRYFKELQDLGYADQDRATVATALHHDAWTYFEQGDVASAIEASSRSRMLYEQIDDVRGLADALEQQGMISLFLGAYAQAETDFTESLAIRGSLGNKHGIASLLLRLASTRLKQHRYFSAGSFLVQSVSMYWKIGVLNFRQLLHIIRRLFLIG